MLIKNTGWTYQEYLIQPVWLIEALITMNNLDAEKSNNK